MRLKKYKIKILFDLIKIHLNEKNVHNYNLMITVLINIYLIRNYNPALSHLYKKPHSKELLLRNMAKQNKILKLVENGQNNNNKKNICIILKLEPKYKS